MPVVNPSPESHRIMGLNSDPTKSVDKMPELKAYMMNLKIQAKYTTRLTNVGTNQTKDSNTIYSNESTHPMHGLPLPLPIATRPETRFSRFGAPLNSVRE